MLSNVWDVVFDYDEILNIIIVNINYVYLKCMLNL